MIQLFSHRLLACDLDGTLIPLESGPAFPKAVFQFQRMVESVQNLTLAYVTGRDLQLACSGIEQYGLPVPNIICGDVGTTLVKRENGRWIPDPGYRKLMQSRFGNATASQILNCLQSQEGLQPQEADRQGEFKASFYASEDVNLQSLQEQILRRLERERVNASIISSKDSTSGQMLIDVLPHDVGKDTAVQYMMEFLNLSREQVLFAGDSGNDLRVFTSGIPSIVVANTDEKTRDKLRAAVSASSQLQNSVFFATQQYTAGVTEGIIQRWFPEEIGRP